MIFLKCSIWQFQTVGYFIKAFDSLKINLYKGWEVGKCFYSSTYKHPVFVAPLIEGTVFSHIYMFLVSLSKDQVVAAVWAYIRVFCLSHFSMFLIFTPIHSVYLEISYCAIPSIEFFVQVFSINCRVTWEDSHTIIVNLIWSSHLERSLNEGLTRSSWLADRPVVLLIGLLDVGIRTLNMGNAIFWAGAWTEWKGKNKLSISKACMHSFSLCSWAWIWLDAFWPFGLFHNDEL